VIFEPCQLTSEGPSLITEEDIVNLLRIGGHANEEIAVRRNFFRTLASSTALSGKPLCTWRIDIISLDIKVWFPQEVASHAEAHGAKANEADTGRVGVVVGSHDFAIFGFVDH